MKVLFLTRLPTGVKFYTHSNDPELHCLSKITSKCITSGHGSEYLLILQMRKGNMLQNFNSKIKVEEKRARIRVFFSLTFMT